MTSHEQNLLNELREKLAEARDIADQLSSLRVALFYYHGPSRNYLEALPDTVRGQITTITKLD